MIEQVEVVNLPTEDRTDIVYMGVGGNLRYKVNRGLTGINQHIYITVDRSVEPVKAGDWFIHNNRILAKCTSVDGTTINFTDDNGIRNGLLSPRYNRKVIATTDPKLLVRECSEEVHNWGKKFISQVSQSFLKEFAKSPDEEYKVEYEIKSTIPFSKIAPNRDRGYINKPKLNKDNTINIILAKTLDPIQMLRDLRDSTPCDEDSHRHCGCEKFDAIIDLLEEKRYSLQEHKHGLRTVVALCRQEPSFILENWIKENL